MVYIILGEEIDGNHFYRVSEKKSKPTFLDKRPSILLIPGPKLLLIYLMFKSFRGVPRRISLKYEEQKSIGLLFVIIY